MSKPANRGSRKNSGLLGQTDWFSKEMQARIGKRYISDRRFRRLGIMAIALALSALIALMGSIVISGVQGFQQTQIRLTVYIDPGLFQGLSDLSPQDVEAKIRMANYGAIVRKALTVKFPDVLSRRGIWELNKLVSIGARNQLRTVVLDSPGLVGSTLSIWVPASADVDTYYKSNAEKLTGVGSHRLTENQLGWVAEFGATSDLRKVLSRDFFVGGDSREPELAGIWGAFVGSLLTLLVTLAVSFPLGVVAAIYLEELHERTVGTRCLRSISITSRPFLQSSMAFWVWPYS